MVKDVLGIRTKSRVEIVDITNGLKNLLKESNIKNGIMNVFSRHSTSAIVINENETGLVRDFQDALESLIPTDKNYRHNRIDNNADSHIRSFFTGVSQTIPTENGSLNLGTWQSVFFIELDGPRNRQVIVTIIGE